MLKEQITPYQSCTKSIFVLLGLILILWSLVFSLILISYGAWPISIFLGVEYLLLVSLIKYYFKEKDIVENIIINSEEIKIERIKKKKIYQTVSFKTYWSKIYFHKFNNKSKLSIRQSSKEEELVSFLHTDLKEALYNRLKKKLFNA